MLYTIWTPERCLAAATDEQWQLVKLILRNVAGMTELGLHYGATARSLRAMAVLPG